MNEGGVMIIGLGDLGGYALEFLARVPGISRIVTADVDEEWGTQKTNSAIIGGSQFNSYPQIEFVKMDLNDISATAETLHRVHPDIVFNCTTLQSWWVRTQLPPPLYEKIDQVRSGPWLPMHLALTYKLMQAVKESGIKAHIVNAAFPDAVNPTLAKVGLAPTVGIGNIDNIVPSLKLAVSRKMNVPLNSITLFLVAPHFFSYFASRFGHSGGAPYFMKILVYDKNVTDRLKPEELLSDLNKYARRPGGIRAHPVVASSVVRIIRGILHDTRELGHAPGPNGLPGGFPIVLSSSGVEIVLPEEINLKEAICINESAQKLDGIEEIKDDGTVIIADESADIMKKLLNYDCKVYRLSEINEKAKELDRLYKEYVHKHRA